MSAITLGWIYGEMFDIVEFAEIPIGNESYRSIMMENNIVIEVRSVIGVQAQLLLRSVFFRWEGSGYQLFHVLIQKFISGADTLKSDHNVGL